MSFRRVLYVFFVIVVAGISALAGSVAGGLAVYRTLNPDGQTQPALNPAVADASQDVAETTQNRTMEVSTTEIETTITTAVEKVGPAVVTVVGQVPGQNNFFFEMGGQEVSGSGVIISQDGYILTNNHVVEGVSELSVILADGTQLSAEIVGTDIYADLAVLKVGGERIPAVAQLGNSDTLKPGETVIAIGSPLGDFKNSVTVGVVSATGRSIDTGQGYSIEGLIQTDAAINSGNSGGPLINLAGELIGINTLVVRGSNNGGASAEGLGFSIPINTARAVAEQIIEKGYFSRPYLGIRWQPITPEVAAAYNLSVQWGIYLTEIVPDSPAAQSGLRPGDIITRIGDKALDADNSFVNALFAYQAGEMVPLEIVREGQAIEVQVTLGEATAQ